MTRPSRSVEAVLCDVDGVLRHWDAQVTAALERRYGLAAGVLLATAFTPARLLPRGAGHGTGRKQQGDTHRDHRPPTQPGGEPPLHTHDSEESHIVLHGEIEYMIGDRRFTVEGPYVARVPAGVPHTLLNVGTEPFNLIAVFPDKHLSYKELGKNPLVKPQITHFCGR